jgi:hypothetical protein
VQENVGEAKMYTLDEAVSIADGETKQVVLTRSGDVPVKREYFVTEGYYYQAREDQASKQSVSVRLKMVNDEKHNLGKALPAGEVIIYQYDSTGAPQKIGTSSLGHLAAGEKFKLEFGPSSDIKATRRITDIKDTEEPRPVEAGEGRVFPQGNEGFEAPPMSAGPRTTSHRPRNAREVAASMPVEPVEPLRFREEERELVISNYKGEAVEVVVTETVPHNATWLKKPEKHEFVEESAGSHSMRVSIGANEKATVKYRIRYQTNV